MTERVPAQTRDTLKVRLYRQGDERAILDCYNKIFAAPRDLRHWHWKFRDNPTGRTQLAVAEDTATGQVVGQYASLPLVTWMEGVRITSSQIVDLMVLPQWRTHGGRPGLFAQIGRLWIDQFINEAGGHNVFSFGWPVPAWRAGQKYLGYLNIRDWDLLFRELPVAQRAVSDAVVVTQVERYGPDVDLLWDAMQKELRLAVVRDARYLNWRFADHPDVRYRMFECRDAKSGALRGLAVYSIGDWPRPKTAVIADWLLPQGDHDATVALVARCEQQAAADEALVLTTIFNHVDPRFLTFQRLGFMVLGTSYFIVIVTSPRLDTVYYRDNLYVTPGDSDLV